MDDVVLARHGESETAAAGVVGGDASLTAAGRSQAHELGRSLAGRPVDVCLTSSARRAQETAALALEGRSVPVEIVPELADIDFGDFAGAPLAAYREWIATHAPDERPPGGESRVATVRRFCEAYRGLLARPEAHLLVVAHGLTLSALVDDPPRPIVAGVGYGSSLAFSREELEESVARLERWCEAPRW